MENKDGKSHACPSSDSNGQEEATVIQDKNSYRTRVLQTILMAGIMLYLGLSDAILGTSLIDFSEMMNKTYEEVSTTVICLSLGGMTASFLGSFIVDRWRTRANLAIGLTVLLSATAVTVLPWSSNLPIFGILLTIQGGGSGILTIATMTLVLILWGGKASAPAHFIQLAYTIGGTVAPTLTTQFLSPDAANVDTAKFDINDFNISNLTLSKLQTNQSRIFIPYSMVGGFGILLAVTYFIIHVAGFKYESAFILPRKSFREMVSVKACTGETCCYGLYMLVSLFFVCLLVVMGNDIRNLHLTAVAVDSNLGISKKVATLMLSSTYLSGALGKFLVAVFSHRIRIEWIFFTELIGNIIFNACVFGFGFQSQVHLWTLVCCNALITSPLFTSTICWSNMYMECSGCVLYILDTGGKLGKFLSAWIGGIVLTQYGPRYVFVLILIVAVLALAIMSPLQLISCIGKRQVQYTRVKAVEAKIDDSLSETSVLIDKHKPQY